jgi:hypothetical protein
MFIARKRIEAPALRQECNVNKSRERRLVMLGINMALLTECAALFFRDL